MALRDTQHYTEVLCTNDSVLRDTQHYVEVLCRGPITLEFVDNLSLTQAASAIVNWPASDSLALSQSVSVTQIQGDKKTAVHPITLTQTVGLLKSKGQPVTHNLVLSDLARYSPINIAIVDTLTLTDTADANSLFENITHTLVLSDEAVHQHLDGQLFEDTLEITDFARLSVRPVQADNLLDLEDVAICVGPRYVSAVDVLQIVEPVLDPETLTFSDQVTGGLQDSVLVTVVVTHLASSIVSFADQAIGYVLRADAIEGIAEDTLTLTDTAQLSTVLSASDTLTMTDSASALSGVPVAQALDLLDSVTVNISHAGVTLEDELELIDSVRFILERDCLRFKFSPFIGSNTDPNAPTPPPSALPDEYGTAGFRLQYPSTGLVTDEVIITKGPEFGNIDRFQMDRINRESRGGTLLVYADPIWPKITTLVLRFSAIGREQGQELLRFIQEHIGQEIILIDWENRAWTGVITNPQDPLVQDDRNSYTASFEFEGERV